MDADPASVKRLIYEDLQQADEPHHPAAIQRRWREVSRQWAIVGTRDRVVQAGGTFEYHSCDVTQGLSGVVGALLEAGRIHGVIHGAGVIADDLIANKTIESFRRVVRTKAEPVFELRELLADEPLRFAFFLSSLASHTGTAGQTDYAAANEVLNATAADWNRDVDYPVRSLLFSVWEEAGLASTSLIRSMHRLNLRGIKNHEGVRVFLDEVAAGEKDQPWVLYTARSMLDYASRATAGDP